MLKRIDNLKAAVDASAAGMVAMPPRIGTGFSGGNFSKGKILESKQLSVRNTLVLSKINLFTRKIIIIQNENLIIPGRISKNLILPGKICVCCVFKK